MKHNRPIESLKLAFGRLGVPFLIGGSVASSARGIPRFTRDVDILVRLLPDQAERLASELGPEWYVDHIALKESLGQKRCFNIVHLPTGLKFDLFPAFTNHHQQQLERASHFEIQLLEDQVVCPVATAEDILLAKLDWYRQGGESSERQWNDILGIFATNERLDEEYLSKWAAELGVTDLLRRAAAEWRE